MLPLVVLSVIAAVCFLGSYWLGGSDLSLILVKKGGYWLILSAFLVFVFSLYQNRKSLFPQPSRFFKTHRWVFLVSAVTVTVYFLVQGSWFKITMDEFVLASTSMQMHLEKEVFTASRAYEINGVYYLLGGYLDKRPYFFAFLVSLVHDLFGYRSGNVFAVNAVVSFLFLASMFFIGRMFGGNRWGWLAFLLTASIPLFGFNVTGGGFELFNLLWIILTAYLGKCWLDKPSDSTLVAFTYSGLLLAQCRYESVLFVFPVAFLIFYGWWREKQIRLPWPMFFAPLVLVPYVLQNRMLNESEILWQLEEHQPSPFGLHYLNQNLESAFNFFTHWGWSQSNSPLLLLITIISLLLWIAYRVHYGAFYPKEDTSWRPVVYAFSATIVFNFLLLLFYYWGQLDDPVATRLGLPFLLVLVIFAVYVLSRNPWKQVAGLLAIVACLVFSWFYTIPNIVQAHYTQGIYDARQIRWANEFLERRKGPLLVMHNFHLSTLVEGISSFPIDHGLNRLPELKFHFENNTFSEVLLIQREPTPGSIHPEKLAPQQQDTLSKHFELRTLISQPLGPGVKVVIHKVEGIKLNEDEAKVYQEHLNALASAEEGSGVDRTTYFSRWLP